VLDLYSFFNLLFFPGNLRKALIYKAWADAKAIYQQSYPQKHWITFKVV